MTDPQRCPRCANCLFEVRITTSAVDQDVDVTGEDRFLLNELVVAEPDTIDVEAVCTQCAHVRVVPEDQWEWA